MKAFLKCLYTNTCSLGNEQEKLGVSVQLHGYSLTRIKEMVWYCSHDWNATIAGNRLFRKDRLGRWERRQSSWMYGIMSSMGQMMFQLRIYASGLNGRPTWLTLLWVSATDHLIRSRWDLLKTSERRFMSAWDIHLISGPWETLITPTSAEGQQNSTKAIQDTWW